VRASSLKKFGGFINYIVLMDLENYPLSWINFDRQAYFFNDILG